MVRLRIQVPIVFCSRRNYKKTASGSCEARTGCAMKFKPPMFTRAQICKRGKLAFTLAEVLAALVFMAIVIPVAVEGLRVASRAGQFGQRKATATRIAEKVINELLVSGQLQTGGQTGTSQEGGTQYRWSIRSQAWSEDTMSQ